MRWLAEVGADASRAVLLAAQVLGGVAASVPDAPDNALADLAVPTPDLGSVYIVESPYWVSQPGSVNPDWYYGWTIGWRPYPSGGGAVWGWTYDGFARGGGSGSSLWQTWDSSYYYGASGYLFGYDWPSLHAALNDLPAALLFVTVLFDLAAWKTKRASSRRRRRGHSGPESSAGGRRSSRACRLRMPWSTAKPCTSSWSSTRRRRRS